MRKRKSKDREIWIGIDVGGTRIKGGVMTTHGAIMGKEVEPTLPLQSFSQFEAQLLSILERLEKKVQTRPCGIGLSLSGPIDPKKGCVYLPGKIKYLSRHMTVPFLREKLKLPVIADNDGRLACLAEWKLGAGRNARNLVVLTLGTGIGSGVVLNEKLLWDRHFQLGTQCGHFVIRQGGSRCLTQARGTGESICSITAFVEKVRDHLSRGLPSRLDSIPSQSLDFQKIVQAVEKKDKLASVLFEEWIEDFGHVLLNAFYAYTPDVMVLSGGPVAAAHLFMKPLNQFLNRTAFRYPPHRKIEVKKATLGEDAGWMGAALRAKLEFQV